MLQWLPPFKSDHQDKSVGVLRAVKSACPANTNSYIFPATDKSNASLTALVSAFKGPLLNLGMKATEPSIVGILSQ